MVKIDSQLWESRSRSQVVVPKIHSQKNSLLRTSFYSSHFSNVAIVAAIIAIATTTPEVIVVKKAPSSSCGCFDCLIQYLQNQK